VPATPLMPAEEEDASADAEELERFLEEDVFSPAEDPWEAGESLKAPSHFTGCRRLGLKAQGLRRPC
jgi:hypothetical protein